MRGGHVRRLAHGVITVLRATQAAPERAYGSPSGLAAVSPVSRSAASCASGRRPIESGCGGQGSLPRVRRQRGGRRVPEQKGLVRRDFQAPASPLRAGVGRALQKTREGLKVAYGET